MRYRLNSVQLTGVIPMENVLLKENDIVLVKGVVTELTPMGFECDVELEDMSALRKDSGKFRYLDIEMMLSSHGGECSVTGAGCVHSVRRISQSHCKVTVRFKEIEQNGYKLISEHISPNPVVHLDDMRAERQSRRA
tara:strand:- start:448 stop:858 length:411 start_codon:yes stop_codon:yes gene_type:complete